MKRCSASLIIREMQIKTTMRYHFIPVRMAVIKKSTNNKCWWGCGKNATFVHCWWKCKLVQPLWKTVWRFLKKLNLELPYDPVYIWEKMKTLIQKDTYTHMFLLHALSTHIIWLSTTYNNWVMEASAHQLTNG